MRTTASFEPSGFFVLRTPLLPLAEFVTWGEGLETPLALGDAARLECAYNADCARLRERLHVALTQPEVRDAIFLAAPNIIEHFHFWTDTPVSERGRKIERVLVRYFSRMTGRATPFGLFAGCSLGSLGDETRLTIEGRDNYQRHTRLDMGYLDALINAITSEATLKNLFLYRPNSTLYRAAGRLRYVESRLKGKERFHHLIAVEETDYLAATLAHAREGATPEALAAALADDDISPEEARAYISELIESQILVADIALPVTGSEPLRVLADQLREHVETLGIAHTLERADAELKLIDKAGLGIEPTRYCSLARELGSLPAEVELSRLFQVDMTKPAPAALLGGAALDEIMRAVEMLRRLSPQPERDLLRQFREAFVARYEAREVPLAEALDDEAGVGFGTSEETSPLLKKFSFPSPDEENPIENKRFHELLLRKLSEAWQSGAQRIDLTPKEIEAISNQNPPPLPDAFAVTAQFGASSQRRLAEGEFELFVESVAGPSGAGLLGRFCHCDEVLCRHVLSHLRNEEALQPKAIFAEIVHLPEGRIGNVILRPVLRDYEIPYLARSGAPHDRQIPIADLYVSVCNGRIHVRSSRLNREVIPRLTNVHDYMSESLAVYKFLAMVAHQNVAEWAGWNWGVLAKAPFLPRVTSGRLVLALARWRASQDELRTLGEKRGAARYQATQKWREARGLPRFVALADADNLLAIDFQNALSVESFVQLVKKRAEATLLEMFPAPDQLCVHGPEGSYTHELVVPFVKRKKEKITDDGARLNERKNIRSSFPRRFFPGSEWLYLKLYTGTATADALLREIVRPLTKSLLQSGAIDQWFFIRHGDPDWHLRLRMHGSPEKLQREVLAAVNPMFSTLLADGRVWRAQFDTYEREMERYGGEDGTVLTEQLFHVDSEAALEILELLEPGDAGADERWRLTLPGIDLLLTDFGLDLNEKHAVLERARADFAAEFRADRNLLGQLSENFRKERRNLEDLFAPAHGNEHPFAPGFAVLHRRSEQLAPIVAGLKACEEVGRLTVSIPELLPSYIHMHANRLLRSSARQQELVIYHLLAHHYESQCARERKTSATRL